ncbi:energy-coupling factor transporter transmembrane component T [Lactobacillaceae bacterium L1_55_11]|nr:energy-coupling factor transporter transmembrane component T [Lactobacillaceae bacterium L1_55_11]
MNASQKLILVLLLSLELAFTQSAILNLMVVGACLVAMVVARVSWRRLLFYLGVAAIPVLGTFLSFWFYGSGSAASNGHIAWVMSTRLLAFISLGAWFAQTVNPYVLMTALEQNFKLSPTFVYGILGALNFLPKFKTALKNVLAVAQMRGQSLHVWSPALYAKALIQSLAWSENLAQAMTAHGFQEGAPRTHFRQDRLPLLGWLILALILVLVQLAVFRGHWW